MVPDSRTPTVRGGAVCFPRRFGGSLNLNVIGERTVALRRGMPLEAQLESQKLP